MPRRKHTKRTTVKDIRLILGSARLVEAPNKEHVPEESTLAEEALERARAQVAARWAAELDFNDDGVHLTHRSDVYPSGPHPDECDITLEVGLLHGGFVVWRKDQVLLCAAEKTTALKSNVQEQARDATALLPAASRCGAFRNEGWKLDINADVVLEQ